MAETGRQTAAADRHGPEEYLLEMEKSRGPLAAGFAEQVLETTEPFRRKPADALDVLDIGAGFGQTAIELARRCRSVIGMEPTEELATRAAVLVRESGLSNVSIRHAGAETLDAQEAYDLVVLDNVYEHLPEQRAALRSITRALRAGGVLYLLAPNKLWPMEAHYRLPFLSYLPLPAANAYLRVTGRGTDYRSASYAPTLRSIGRDFATVPELKWRCVLPADRSATMSGSPLHYRVGMKALEVAPCLWAISKALLIVAVKRGG